MRILIDKYIPFIEGVFDAYAEVVMLEPEQFTVEEVKDADVLIIRTRTRCNAELLEGRIYLDTTYTAGGARFVFEMKLHKTPPPQINLSDQYNSI